MTRQVFSLVTLRHDHEPGRRRRRMAVVEDMVDEVVHERHEVRAEGDGALAQVLDLVFQGDVVSAGTWPRSWRSTPAPSRASMPARRGGMVDAMSLLDPRHRISIEFCVP